MTLCIAWKINDAVHFATDSRVSVGAVTPSFDNCVKVASVGIEIMGPLNEGDKYPDQLYVSNLGFCFSGSFLSAYTIKEILINTLSSLQVIPGITNVSMDNVCKLICKFYEDITGSLSYLLSDKGLSEIVVTGYCPKHDSVKTFLFDFEISNMVDVSYKEILKKNGDVVFLGSGKGLAKRTLPRVDDYHVLKTVKTVIDNKSEPSVGGALQYGSIKSKTFSVFGVRDYTVDHAQKTIKIGFQYAGINLDKNPYKVTWDEFHLKQTYIDPFQKEIERFLKSGYEFSTDSL